MSIPLRVLIVEDSEDDALLLARELSCGGYAPDWRRVDTSEAMEAALYSQSWDIIVSDYNMPRFSASKALDLCQRSGLDVPFIIVSGVIGEHEAVAAMKAGAHDYILKSNLPRLIPAIDRELREAATRRERQNLEEQLRQAQKMESIGRLAGGVAHDFNNLLTPIMCYAQMGALALPAGHKLRGHFDEINRTAERASNLTRQLLAFSRRQVIEPKIFNLNTLITDMEKLLRRLISEDVELITQTAPDLGMVKADPGQLEQVLLNLVVNARDAITDNGRIEVATENVMLDEAYTRQHPDASLGPHVMLSVCDDGPGMTEDIKSQIFEPFFTTKEEGKGTGLGLSTCYGIVRQSGGHIEVRTQPGLGTTFKIYLPQARQPASASSAALEDHHLPQGAETVLLAEDEPLVRAMITTMLSDQGYTVLATANGSEALRVAQENPDRQIDLLLADIVMPQMGGVELANRLSAVRPGARVLFTSGYNDEPVIREGAAGAGIEFIQKPFVPRTLIRKVREVLDR